MVRATFLVVAYCSLTLEVCSCHRLRSTILLRTCSPARACPSACTWKCASICGGALLGFAVIFLITLSLDGVGYATNTGIGVAKPLLDFIAQPVEQELRRWHERQEEQRLTRLADEPREVEIELDLRQLAEFLGLPAGGASIHPPARPDPAARLG